jgi:hypothetical protein
MVRMALDLVSQLVGAIVRFVRQFPQLAVAVVLGVLAFAAMYPERARKALDAARTACADLWTLVGPHLIAFGTVAQTRLVEAAETRQRLTAVRATVA